MDELAKRRRLEELKRAGFAGQLVQWGTPPDALLPYLVKVDTLFNTTTQQDSPAHVLLVAPPGGEAGWAFTIDQVELLIEELRDKVTQARKLNGT